VIVQDDDADDGVKGSTESESGEVPSPESTRMDKSEPRKKFEKTVFDVREVVIKHMLKVTGGVTIGQGFGGADGEPTNGITCVFNRLLWKMINQLIIRRDGVAVDIGCGIGTTALACFSILFGLRLICFEFNIQRLIFAKQHMQREFMRETNNTTLINSVCKVLEDSDWFKSQVLSERQNPSSSSCETIPDYLESQASSINFLRNRNMQDIFDFFNGPDKEVLRSRVTILYLFSKGMDGREVLKLIQLILPPHFFPNLQFVLTSVDQELLENESGRLFNVVHHEQLPLRNSLPKETVGMTLYEVVDNKLYFVKDPFDRSLDEIRAFSNYFPNITIDELDKQINVLELENRRKRDPGDTRAFQREQAKHASKPTSKGRSKLKESMKLELKQAKSSLNSHNVDFDLIKSVRYIYIYIFIYINLHIPLSCCLNKHLYIYMH